MGLVEMVVPRFRVLDREMAVREEFRALPKAVRDQRRLERLNDRWCAAVHGSRYYAVLAKKLGLPELFESLDEFRELVPVTPRQALRDRSDEFRLPGHRRGKWMRTGGSTGVPTRVFWGLDGHLESLRDQYWARSWWGVGVFDRQAMLWGHASSHGGGLPGACGRMMVPLTDRLRGRIRFNAYQLDRESLRTYFDRIVRFRPVSLYAYGSAAHLLAVANRGRAGPDSLKVAFLAAEPIQEMFRESIGEVFGCPCAGEYGSIDCGMIAYEHPEGKYRVFERSVIVETVPREGGYEILVTQLRDTGFPLFRYEIGDMTPMPLGRAADGGEVLEAVSGRSYDMLRSPTGAVCYGGMVTQILKQLADVALFTVRQGPDYGLSILIQTVSGNDIGVEGRRYVASEVAKLLPGVRVEISQVPALGRTPAGKHRWITSEAGVQPSNGKPSDAR
ncbi:MAG TPA: hypothetical protein VM223_21865 [Planctomycetota bacterium]|nr:hypothetical protein [Planctomycetota bacterium]